MALTMTVTEKGININSCYIRVKDFTGNKSHLGFNVEYLSTSTEKPFLTKGYSFNYDMETSNPIKQAYEHLKTLPEFSGAIDC